jgi:hypothetical protein
MLVTGIVRTKQRFYSYICTRTNQVPLPSAHTLRHISVSSVSNSMSWLNNFLLLIALMTDKRRRDGNITLMKQTHSPLHVGKPSDSEISLVNYTKGTTQWERKFSNNKWESGFSTVLVSSRTRIIKGRNNYTHGEESFLRREYWLKKFPASYRALRFITISTRERQWTTSWVSETLSETYSDITLVTMLRCSKRSIPFSFSLHSQLIQTKTKPEPQNVIWRFLSQPLVATFQFLTETGLGYHLVCTPRNEVWPNWRICMQLNANIMSLEATSPFDFLILYHQ